MAGVQRPSPNELETVTAVKRWLQNSKLVGRRKGRTEVGDSIRKERSIGFKPTQQKNLTAIFYKLSKKIWRLDQRIQQQNGQLVSSQPSERIMESLTQICTKINNGLRTWLILVFSKTQGPTLRQMLSTMLVQQVLQNSTMNRGGDYMAGACLALITPQDV